MTHHRVAGLEDLAEQDGALSLGKRFSEWTEAARVSDVWAVYTLRRSTDTCIRHANSTLNIS